MTQFQQEHQAVWGIQQNAGHDIINNTFPKATWQRPVMLPPRSQSFVGREEDLSWLLEHLTSEDGGILGICGPGGMGKTALVAEALKRLTGQKDWQMSFPDGIFYHSFYTYPSLNGAFEELARVFGGEPSGDPYLAARRAVSHRHALLIFDGVEVLTNTRRLRELGGKNVVLILSRRRSDAPDHTHRRDLNVLPQELAIELLQKLAGPYAAHRQSIEQLVRYISGYPLALQLIGNYLSSNQQEAHVYLRWFEDKGLAMINFGEHQDQSVQVLLRRTYDALTSSEQQLFLLQGLLAPAPFPWELAQTILELPEQATQQALGVLVNLSVLRRQGQHYEVSHPLIHTFATEQIFSQTDTLSSLSSETIPTWQEQLVNTLSTHFERSNPYDRRDFTLWYPHVLRLLSANNLTTEQSLKRALLFNFAGMDASTQGKYGEAEPLYVRALAISEQQLGPDHPQTATSLNNLAGLYNNQGKYEEAEPLYVRALAISEQQLGPDHPETATSLNNLAPLYKNQGNRRNAA
jgi:tetratricopeptide (TPR) repeat protein